MNHILTLTNWYENNNAKTVEREIINSFHTYDKNIRAGTVRRAQIQGRINWQDNKGVVKIHRVKILTAKSLGRDAGTLVKAVVL